MGIEYGRQASAPPEGDTMLDENDVKLVKRSYLLPKIAWYSIASIPLTTVLVILLTMYDNITFGTVGSDIFQFIVFIALVVIETIVGIVCCVKTKSNANSAHWQELERSSVGRNTRTDMNDAVAGGVGMAIGGNLVKAIGDDGLDIFGSTLQAAGGAVAAYGFFESMNRLSKSAAAVGRAHGIRLPRLGAVRLAALGTPLIVLALASAPRLVNSANTAAAAQDQAAAAMAELTSALERAGADVSADDPIEQRENSGYIATGRLIDESGEPGACVTVKTDESGVVTSLMYDSPVDLRATPEENLARAEEGLAQLYGALHGADVRYADSGLSVSPLFPEEFRLAFLGGDYYTELSSDLDDTGTLHAWAFFSTAPRDEFNEYTDPSLGACLMASTI